MADVETQVMSEGAVDEEARVIEATDSEVPQVEANAPVRSPDVPKELPADNDAHAVPSPSVLAELEEEEPVAMVTEEGMEDEVEGEQKKASTTEKEEEKKEVGTRRKNAQRRAVRRKKKAAGNDGSAELSGSVFGRTEEQASAVVSASSNDKVGEQGEKKEAKNEGVEEGTKKGALSKKASRTQRRKKPALAAAATSTAATVEITEGNNEESMDVEEKVENALTEEGDTQKPETEALTTSAALNSEAAKDNNGEEKVADKEKVDGAPRKKNKNRKKKNKRNNAQVAASEADKAAEVGAANKLSDAKDIAGMIFMCSSKTKMDCYKYKIFGMPAGKKETVAKAYKGMKLFLYDIDLKLMYGIYKASSKGGYNIQPKAFKSSFPSQVRFKVLKECLPLPEEKFKAAIKANYFKKHAFRCELSAEQVKNLSKLFFEATKASRVTNGKAVKKRAPQAPASHDTKRRRYQDTVSRPLVVHDDHMFPRSHDIYEREAYVPPLRFPVAPYGSGAAREAPLPLYSSPPRLSALPPPPPAYAAYERPLDVDYHRRELPPPLEGHGYRIVDPEIPPSYDLDRVGHSDPYGMHREPAPYHETRYPTLASGYYPPAPSSYYPPAYPPYGR